MPGVMLGAAQRSDDKARIGLAAGPLRFGHDTALAVPTVQCRPHEVLEAARRPAGNLALLSSLGELGCDLIDQPAVAGQPKQVLNHYRLAPVGSVGGWKPVQCGFECCSRY
jgi:hypothetical protein